MESKKFFRGRVRILSFLIILMGLFVLFRLFSLQVVKSEDYLETADRSYVRSSDTFDRGSIFFEKRDGARLSAATINSGFILTINPSRITDAETTFEKLNEIVTLDREDFIERANKKGDPYEEVADKITRQKADQINELDLSGVTLYKQKWRFYPGKELAAHTIGFLGFGGGTCVNGLESIRPC